MVGCATRTRPKFLSTPPAFIGLSSIKSYNQTTMKKNLQAYGLSEKEAAVYAAALELGPATADQLAKQAEVKRPTTYVQIESLQEMGLMSSYEEGKKTLFTPESPENLARLLDRQKAELDQKQKELSADLPELIRSFEGAGERPVVRFYQGKEGVLSLRKEILKAESKKLKVIFSWDALAKVFTYEERLEYSETRGEYGIELQAIYTREEGPFDEITNPLSSMKFVSPDKLPVETDIAIYDNKVALTSLSEPLSGVLIENEHIANSMLAMFNLLWESN